jgi:hypothetical protein
MHAEMWIFFAIEFGVACSLLRFLEEYRHARIRRCKKTILHLLLNHPQWWRDNELNIASPKMDRDLASSALDELHRDLLIVSRYESDDEFTQTSPDQERGMMRKITKHGALTLIKMVRADIRKPQPQLGENAYGLRAEPIVKAVSVK